MRIFVSLLLLALSGDKKDSKCTSDGELTNSYIPAGLQVLHHYVAQIRESYEEHSEPASANKIRRHVEDIRQTNSSLITVPTIEVTYNVVNTSHSNETNKNLLKLELLALVLEQEANEQTLSECKGLTVDVMEQLEKTSKLSSIGQLAFILKNISNGELKRSGTEKVIDAILTDLENGLSELNKELRSVKPLKYLSDSPMG